MKIELPPQVIEAIEKYNASTFKEGSIGALNCVAFIGEQVARLYKTQKDKNQ